MTTMPPPQFHPSTVGKVTSRRLRVAIVAPTLEQVIGGQEIQAQLLLKSWAHDPAVQALYVPTNSRLPPWLECAAGLRTVIRFPLYSARLIQRLKNSDIVHIFSAAFSSFTIATLPAFWVARALGKTVLVNYHSGLAGSHLSASRLARNVMRRADAVIVPSRYLVDVLGQFRIAAQPIPNVVDASQFRYRERIPLQPRLLCTRNFEPCYGIDILLHAFAEIQGKFPDAHLMLVGEGSQKRALQELISGLALKNVTLPGRVDRERIGSFYDTADIFINASRIDNMPVSILEAMTAGLPVVTTNPGGIPYIVRDGHTGLLCPVDNWRHLAANVIRLLQEPALALRLANNGQQQASQYDWKEIRASWLQVYRALLSDSDPGCT